MPSRALYVGASQDDLSRPIPEGAPHYDLAPHQLVTHTVVLGMTGSGKTGLATVLIEEVLSQRIPVLMIDIKGDLPNLLLTFPTLSPEEFLPWVDAEAATRNDTTPEKAAADLSATWKGGLARSGLSEKDVAAFRESIAPMLITPGAPIGMQLNMLSSLDQPSPLWKEDEAAAHDALAASVSLVLRLVGRDGDPRAREHVVLSTLAERRLRAGESASLPILLRDVMSPPIPMIGALPFDSFFPKKEQNALAQDLNTLLASPKLATWLRGAPLDIASWLAPKPGGKTPAVIVSVAHLDDEERALVLGVLLEEVLSYVRGLSGTSELRAMVVFDELYGFLPPHPHDPPTKRPLLALLKQARAFGVGLMLATQNPMDLDYKALSNAGVWFIGRLQTDADRERVVEGLSGLEGAGSALEPSALSAIIKGLPKRTFFVRNVHRTPAASLVASRFCLSYLRGPMTRRELARLAKDLGGRASSSDLAPMAGSIGPTGTLVSEQDEAQAAPATASSPPVENLTAAPNAPSVVSTGSLPPSVPEGWRSYHGVAPTTGRVHYVPFVVASVLVRVRDKKLGAATQWTHHLVAPLSEGRPDLSRVALVDPKNLANAPHASASYDPVPASLLAKKGSQAVERAMRDHAMSVPLHVAVNEELEICANEGEARASFLARCAAEAERRILEERQIIASKIAPKLAKLRTRLEAAERQLVAARTGQGQAPSDIGTMFVGLVAGRGAAGRMEKARSKADAEAAKAHQAYLEARTALTEAEASLAAELSESERGLRVSVANVVELPLLPKKGDAEVLAMGIAWSARAG